MPTLIACFVAGICVAGFVTIWFTTPIMMATAAHEDMIAQMSALRKQVINAEATEDALLDAYKHLSDDSGASTLSWTEKIKSC